MIFIPKTIFTGFSPNISVRDVRISLAYLCFPWKWLRAKKGPAVQQLEKNLGAYLSAPQAITYDSGRTALLMALKALGVGRGDEVLVQAYTCVVVINAIRWAGGTPVYLDIGNDFCIDPDDVEKKITDKTTGLIIQHTFGYSADMDRLMAVAQKYDLAVIEDCAHALGATYQGRKLGTFGDIAMFSFGGDKVISSARGGALVTTQESLAQVLRTERDELPFFPMYMLLRHLMHYPAFCVGRFFYSVRIGKWFLGVMKRAHLIHRVIERVEKKGKQVSYAPAQYSHALAEIALPQLAELDQMNAHRKRIAAVYADGLAGCPGVILPPDVSGTIYLRYTIRTDKRARLHEVSRKQHVLLGDWYDTVIAPKDCDVKQFEYTPGSCPIAESYALQSVNLPTDRHVTEQDARRIISMIRTCLTTQ